MDTNNTNPQENPITEFYDHILARPEPASVGIRFLNLIIDYIVQLVIGFVIGIVSALSGSPLRDKFDSYIITFIVFLLYYFICEWTMGRTLGKIVTGTRVVDEQGNKPSVGQVLGRTFARLVPFEAFSFFAGPVGWHDRWTNTVVTKNQ